MPTVFARLVKTRTQFLDDKIERATGHVTSETIPRLKDAGWKF